MLRLSTLIGSVALGAAIAACGSASSSDIFTGTPATTNSAEQDAATEDGATAGDTAPVVPSAADAATGPARDAGDPCPNLRAQVDRLRSDALACSVISLNAQCDEMVADICCKVVVTKDTQAAKNFVDAVKAFKAASCVADCSKAHCPTAPTYTCQPSSGAKGTCSQ